MKRAIRNRLADLLLGAFADPEKRAALAWLALFCTLAEGRDPPEVPLLDLLAERRTAFSGLDGSVEAVLAHVIGPDKLLRLRRADTGEVLLAGMPRQVEGIPWLVEPEPAVRAAFGAVCVRARTYAAVAARLGRPDAAPPASEPVRRALAEAALCFNAGLFFEAHEHLECQWMAQPKGPTKRFLQGIIQISVGFHHAHGGNYDGAVNQLAKGLEKTAGTSGEVLGLDCDTFLPLVIAAREAILARGPANMRPLSLAEIPRMPVRLFP
jgi:hypothetical protein